MNKSKLENKWWIVDRLKVINGDDDAKDLKISYYHKKILVERGFVAVENLKGEGRGRPTSIYKLSGKGRGYLALSTKWKR